MSKQENKVFIGGLSWETSDQKLRSYFENYGTVLEAFVSYDRNTGRPRGFGFVVFESSEVADKVVSTKHTIDRREVEAKKAVPKDENQAEKQEADSNSAKSRKIFVGGLAPSVDEKALKQYFEQFGAVEDAVVMYDHDNKRPRGFGFITFTEGDSVDKVFTMGAMQTLHDKQVEIKPAVPRDKMPPSRKMPTVYPNRGPFPPRGPFIYRPQGFAPQPGYGYGRGFGSPGPRPGSVPGGGAYKGSPSGSRPVPSMPQYSGAIGPFTQGLPDNMARFPLSSGNFAPKFGLTNPQYYGMQGFNPQLQNPGGPVLASSGPNVYFNQIPQPNGFASMSEVGGLQGLGDGLSQGMKGLNIGGFTNQQGGTFSGAQGAESYAPHEAAGSYGAETNFLSESMALTTAGLTTTPDFGTFSDGQFATQDQQFATAPGPGWSS